MIGNDFVYCYCSVFIVYVFFVIKNFVFYILWIVFYLKYFYIMIIFKKISISFCNMIFYLVVYIISVCYYYKFFIFFMKYVKYWFNCIMRDFKGFYLYVIKGFYCFYIKLEFLIWRYFVNYIIYCFLCFCVSINREFVFLSKYIKIFNMIWMFMSN